jgi:hypothetical protein
VLFTSEDASKVSGEIARAKYHPGEIYDLYMGKSKDHLREVLGKPDQHVKDDEGRKMWRYWALDCLAYLTGLVWWSTRERRTMELHVQISRL